MTNKNFVLSLLSDTKEKQTKEIKKMGMMNKERTFRKLERNDFSITNNGNMFVASKEGKNHHIEFFVQGNDAVCINVMRNGTVNHPEFDDFNNCFCNLSTAIRRVDNWTK